MSGGGEREFALHIADRIDGLGPIAVTRFFGGMGLRWGQVQFAFVMKGRLYLRVNEQARRVLETRGGSPFRYRGGSGMVTVGSYSQAPDDILDDDSALSRWAAEALRVALAAKVPLKRTPSSSSATAPLRSRRTK